MALTTLRRFSASRLTMPVGGARIIHRAGNQVRHRHAVTQNGSDTTFSFAWNWNKTKVKNQNPVNGINPVTEGAIFNIENNLPRNRVNIAAIHTQNAWTFMARTNFYDSTIDERNAREVVNSAWIFDLSATWRINDNWSVTGGANNVFDKFPNKISTRVGNGLAYPRRTPIGYDGGSWYLRAQFEWF